jgi:hypothetical protein
MQPIGVKVVDVPMTSYSNHSGNSGVIAYKIEPDRIIIQFAGGDSYVYTYRRPGKTAVEQMKVLAMEGRGLSTYISREVRDKYEAKV